jgi:hypothetical protein
MKKPKFGIVVAVTQSPMAKAYKKAVGKVGPPIDPLELAPKRKTPAEKDPKMLAPKKPGAKKPSPEDSDPGMLKLPKTPSKGKPKDKGMLPPKSGKPPKYKTRTDKKM